MANEFIARKGLISSGSIVVSGSVTASNFNGSLVGTSSWAYNAISSSHSTTASYALTSLNDAPVVIDNYTFIADGATTEYYISKSYSDSSIFVAVGGLTYINPDDYYLSASTLIFTEVPPSSSNISIKALVNVSQNVTGSFSGSFAGDGSGLVNVSAPLQIDTYTIDGDGTTAAFTLDKPYLPESLIVSVDGLVYTYPTDYTVSGTTLTFVDTPTSASTIIVRGFMNTGNVTGSFSGSFVGNGNGLLNVSASFVEYNAIANKPSLVSSSQQINTGSFSGSITTSSFATTASYVIPTGLPVGTVSSSTASSPSQGTVRVTINGVNTDVDTGLQTGDSPTFAGLTVDGAITAKEFYTQFVSSSIIYQSGSTKFGDSDDDVMSVTGSLIVSGSGTFKNIGPSQFSGSVSTTTDMFIGGNVGIGTTTPARILTVYTSASTSRILLQNSSTGQAINNGFDLSMATSGQADIWNYQNADIRIATNNSERVRITSGGFVGIGTINPGQKLHVVGNTILGDSLNNSLTLRNNGNYDTGGGGGSSLFVEFGNQQIARIANTGTGNRDGVFSLSDEGTVKVNIAANNSRGGDTYFNGGGNVGIGTTSPNTKLEVVGRTISTNVVVGAYGTLNDTTGAAQTLQFGNYTANAFIASSADSYIYKTSNVFGGLSAGTLIFQTRGDTNTGGFAWVAGSTPSVKMLLDSSGNVGIGTTSPSALLDVRGNGGASGIIQFGNASGLGDLTANGTATYIGSFSLHPLYLKTNNITRAAIDTSGNFGIGTTSPSAKLDVFATSHITNIPTARIYHYEYPDSTPTNVPALQVLVGKDSEEILNHGFVAIQQYFTGASYDSPPLYFVTNKDGTNSDEYWGLQAIANTRWRIFGKTVANSAGPGTTGFTEYLTIISGSGNVGIGTTTPIYKLDVSGSLGLSGFMFAEKLGNYNRIYEPAGNASIYLGNATDPTNYYDNSVHQWRNRGGGTDYMRLNSVGNLGIGVTDPQAKLHVAGDIRFGTNGVYTDLRTFTDTALSGYNQTNTITPTTVPGSGTATSALYLKTAGSGPGYNRLDLITDGRIGIGTTLPLNLLHIEGSNAFARISNPSTGDGGLKISYQNSDTHGLHLSYNPNNALAYIDNTYPTSSGTVYGDIYFRQNINGTMTSRMMIQAQTGNVGINVTPNNAKLEVVATSGEVFRADAAGGAYRIVANQTGVMMNGNVGIGTTNPTTKFDVFFGTTYETERDIITWRNEGSVGAGTLADGVLGYDNTSSPSVYIGARSNIPLRVKTNNLERMRIDSSGNVLIGTTNPDVGGTFTGSAFRPDGQLLVSNNKTDSISSYVYYGDRRGTNNSGPVYTLAMGGYLKADIGIAGTNATTDDGVITFNTIAGNATRTERMRIRYDGNVGIGTTSPSYLLDIAAVAAGSFATLRINNGYTGASDGSQILLGNSQNFTNAYIRLNGGGNSSQAGIGSLNIGVTEASPIAFYTNNTERMRITSDGYLRINDPNNGAYRVNITDGAGTMLRMFRSTSNTVEMFTTSTSTTVFYITTDNSQGVSLTAGNTSWGSYSDARMKNVVGPITEALNGIAQIEPVKFTWKNDATNKPHVGVLAQSVAPIVPEAVDTDDAGMMSVRYTELIPLLIKAVQELKEENSVLTQRISQLEGVS